MSRFPCLWGLLGKEWYLLGSPISQGSWDNVGVHLLVLDTLAVRVGSLNHNSILQLLKSFRHLMSFFGSLWANFPSWGCHAVTRDIKAGNGIRL